MSKVYVKLSGTATRYNLDGQIYTKGKVFSMPEARAKLLTRRKDQFGRPYFSVLTSWEVEELTGDAPPPPPKPKVAAPVVEIVDETDDEAEARAREIEAAEEDSAFEKEGDISDPDVEVLGGPGKAKGDTLVDDFEEI